MSLQILDDHLQTEILGLKTVLCVSCFPENTGYGITLELPNSNVISKHMFMVKKWEEYFRGKNVSETECSLKL